MNDSDASQSLYELAYISSAVRWMELPHLEAMLTRARQKNHRLAITGMLLYADGAFMQVLEGPKDAVMSLFETIQEDGRHTRVMIIHEGPLQQRHFPDWKMGFRYLDTESFQRQPGFTDLLREGSGASRALREKPFASYQLLLSFSQCSTVVPQLDPDLIDRDAV